MDNIKTKLGQGGRIVLPAEFREALGVKIGDELILSLKDDEIRVFTRRAAIKRAQGMFRHYIAEGRSLSDELIQERRAEAAKE
jgi:AbrB family looped-hinge helix DNA binding protein